MGKKSPPPLRKSWVRPWSHNIRFNEDDRVMFLKEWVRVLGRLAGVTSIAVTVFPVCRTPWLSLTCLPAVHHLLIFVHRRCSLADRPSDFRSAHPQPSLLYLPSSGSIFLPLAQPRWPSSSRGSILSSRRFTLHYVTFHYITLRFIALRELHPAVLLGHFIVHFRTSIVGRFHSIRVPIFS